MTFICHDVYLVISFATFLSSVVVILLLSTSDNIPVTQLFYWSFSESNGIFPQECESSEQLSIVLNLMLWSLLDVAPHHSRPCVADRDTFL